MVERLFWESVLPLVLVGQRALKHVGVDVFYRYCKVKVKVTLVQALRLCTGRTARRGSRGIAVPFYDHGTRRG